MKCSNPNCNAEFSTDYLYCPVCGTEVQMVPDYNEFDEEFIREMIDSDPEKTPKKKKKKTDKKKTGRKKNVKEQSREEKRHRKLYIRIGIITAVMVAIIIGFAGWFWLQRLHANSSEYQIKMAHKAVSDGDLELAAEYYQNAYALDENNSSVCLALADLYEEMEDPDSALEWYAKLLTIDPDNETAYKSMIGIYDRAEDYQAILELSQEAPNDEILALFADYLVEAPAFDPESETNFEDSGEEITLTGDDNCEIYYVINGTDPIESGELYISPISLEEEGVYQISAVCMNEKGIYSDVVSATYIVSIPAPDQPVISPDGGNFAYPTQIYISVPDNCTAYYTWDGSDPTEASDIYTSPITVPVGNHVLSVVIVDNDTGKSSTVYRTNYTYYEEITDDSAAQ